MPFRALAATLVAALLVATRAQAEVPCAKISSTNLVRCVLAHNPSLKTQSHERRAATARKEAARTLLPAMPELALSLSRRVASVSDRSALNWSATLSQELELGGQRGARLRAAAAGEAAEVARLRSAERSVAAQAWQAYVELLAAKEELEIAKLAESAAAESEVASSAMAQAGTLSGSDSDVAEALAIQARQQRLEAERNLRASELRLAAWVSGGASTAAVQVEGKLEPLSGVESHARRVLESAPRNAPDVEAARAEARAFAAQAELHRKERVPNLTVSVFVQRDGFDENVYGGGLSLPLYLPHPLGPTHTGEIAEAEALADRAQARAAELSTERRTRLLAGLDRYAAARNTALLYRAERLEAARHTLSDVSEQVQRGKLSLREAWLVRQPLLELLRGDVRARFELADASIEVAELSGFAFPGGEP